MVAASTVLIICRGMWSIELVRIHKCECHWGMARVTQVEKTRKGVYPLIANMDDGAHLYMIYFTCQSCSKNVIFRYVKIIFHRWNMARVWVNILRSSILDAVHANWFPCDRFDPSRTKPWSTSFTTYLVSFWKSVARLQGPEKHLQQKYTTVPQLIRAEASDSSAGLGTG